MRLIRLSRGEQQQDLAPRIEGASVSTLSHWETGANIPFLEGFISWCRAVEIEPSQAMETVELLLGESGDDVLGRITAGMNRALLPRRGAND